MPEPTEKELDELAEVYYSFDEDNNGYLDCDEFCRMLDQFIEEITQEEKEDAFDLMDTNHDGWVSFSEFIEWWEKR